MSILGPGSRIGFIGLGLMGRPMASNLLRAGFTLTVHTRTRAGAEGIIAAGAAWAGSAAEVAAASEATVTMLPDSPDVEAVVSGPGGLLEGASAGSVWIDMSTISPAVTRALAAAAAARAVDTLDAPVSGGPPGAAEGSLSIMAGGSEAVFDRCLPVLEAMGRTIVRVGGTGAGQVTKACNQVAVGAILAGVAEALTLGSRAGVDPALIRRVLLGGYAQSRMLEVHGQRMLDHDFRPGFFVKLHQKDLMIVLDMARSLGASAPVSAQVVQLMNAAVAAGRGEDDNSALVTVYEELARHRLGD